MGTIGDHFPLEPANVVRRSQQKPTLGPYLEWHGPTIRVVVRIPKERTPAFGGKQKLKETLGTDSPAAAEVLKGPVIARLKALAEGAEAGSPTRKAATSITAEAMRWRGLLASRPSSVPEDAWVEPHALAERAEEIAERHGDNQAEAFVALATGRATPIDLLLDRWVSESGVVARTADKRRQSVRELIKWAEEVDHAKTIETTTRRSAADFISDRFIKPKVHPNTAKVHIGGLRAYWKWLVATGNAVDNPWAGQAGPKAKNSVEDGADKRPFTDDEARRLLDGIKAQPMRDLCYVAALSGMRLGEIVELKVSDIQGDVIRLRGTKTKAARRVVPIHSDLSAIFTRRIKDKGAGAYLFDELPDQTNAARARGAPISQAFTRARRDLQVDARGPGGDRQSGVDFHSWRRFFIAKALNALAEGASGFTPYTIADVVGHSNEVGPLAMTMGRYPGRASVDVLRACVESVKLPPPLRQT